MIQVNVCVQMEVVFVTSVDSLGSVDVDSLPIQILDLGLDRTGVGPTWKSIFPIGFQTFTMRIRIFRTGVGPWLRWNPQ